MTCAETCVLVAFIATVAMLVNGALAHIAIRDARRERDQ
jgi:hypothetical protein